MCYGLNMKTNKVFKFSSESEFKEELKKFIESTSWSYMKMSLEVDIEYTRLWRIATLDCKVYYDEVIKISDFLSRFNNGR